MSSEAACLCCPACHASVRTGDDRAVACSGCGARYPVHAGIPWLFRDVGSARAQWAAKWQHFRSVEEGEIAGLREAAGGAGLMEPTRQRLRRLGDGRRKRLAQIEALLAPFGLDRAAPGTGLPVDRIPSVQHVGSYLDTAFRDWCWGEAEVRESVDWLDARLGDAGRDWDGRAALVLGGGAGRLTCELAALRPFERVFQLDINPLLTRVASLAARGESLALTEVPAIALGLDHVAVEQSLANPGVRPQCPVDFVLGDVFAPPFAAGCFGLVVTPWFVDVLPEDFRMLARRVNRLLAPGGEWISFGPLSFESVPETARYTPEEMVAALGEAGMDVAETGIRRVAYLHSPHGMARRHEEVFGFRASRKEAAARPDEFRAYPAWMTDSSLPVPALPVWTREQHQRIFDVQILGLLDGRRSIDDVVARLSSEYGLPADRCRAVVERFFASFVEGDAKAGR